MAQCKTCGQSVAEVNGELVHDGGGAVTQECRNPSCGWKGGQIGGFSSCPRCGDGTSLATNHRAS